MVSLSELIHQKIEESKDYYSIELSPYRLKNEQLPLLMQDLPALARLSRLASLCEPSIPKVQSNIDAYLTILAIVGQGSLMDLRRINKGFLFDTETFFKKLENVLTVMLNYHREAFRFQKKRLEQSKLISFVEMVNEFIDPDYTTEKFFSSLSYAYTDVCITFQEMDRLNTYVSLITPIDIETKQRNDKDETTNNR